MWVVHSLAGERPGGHSGGGAGGIHQDVYAAKNSMACRRDLAGVEAVICDTEWLDGGRGGERP